MTPTHQALADRLESLDPDDLTVEQLLWWGIIVELGSLEARVAEERRGRRFGFAALTVAIVVTILACGLYAVDTNARKVAALDTACQQRIDSRADVRSFGVSLAADVARFADATPEQVDALEVRATALALKELPPPDC